MELVIYAIFGVGTTCVNWLVYSVAVKFFSMNLNVANIMAWIVAVIFAFIVNKHFVFRSVIWKKDVIIREFSLFVGARVVSGIFEILGLPLLLWLGVTWSLFGVEGLPAKVLVSIVVIILNYIFSKFYIFTNTDNRKEV